MIGVLVNTLAVLAGSLLGLALRRGIPARLSAAAMTGIGLVTLSIGISGALKGTDAVVAIVAVVTGGLLGTWLQLDAAIQRLGRAAERLSRAQGQPGARIGEGLVTASLLFCVGSMTVVGSLNAGLTGDNGMLFAKSALDLVSSTLLSVSLGAGVLLSAGVVLLFQGALVLLAGVLRPVLSAAAVAEMTCAGSLLIIALGLNLLQITKIRVADYLPALLIAPLAALVKSLLG